MPLRSMTAYGRGEASCETGVCTVEIQGTNRRHLETQIYLPRSLMRYEMSIRKQVSERVGRGMVTIHLSWKPESGKPKRLKPNLALANGIKKAWAELADDLLLPPTLPIEMLLREKELLLEEDEESEELFGSTMQKAVDEALERFVTMREVEGETLAKTFSHHLDRCGTLIDEIAPHLPAAAQKLRQKLHGRLEELELMGGEGDERLLREIALYAERIDTTEEQVRFKSHLMQADELISKKRESDKESRGKTLDFLIQELNREANTIGSKAAEVEISQRVVAIKSELEKMREQVQNIE